MRRAMALAVGVLVAIALTLLAVLLSAEWSLFWEHPWIAVERVLSWRLLAAVLALTAFSFFYPLLAFWRAGGDYRTYRGILQGYWVFLWIAVFGLFLLLPAVGIERDGFPEVGMLFIVLSQAAGMKIISSVVFPGPEPPVDAWALAANYMDRWDKEKGPSCARLDEATKIRYVELIAPLLKFAIPAVRKLDLKTLDRDGLSNVRMLVATYLVGASRVVAEAQSLTFGQSRVVIMAVLREAGWDYSLASVLADAADNPARRFPETAKESSLAMASGATDFRKFDQGANPSALDRLAALVERWSRGAAA